MKTRSCSCGESDPKKLRIGANGSCRCRKCLARVAREHYAKNKTSIQEKSRAHRQKNPVPYVLADCRKFDKRSGWVSDLTTRFVEELLSKPCSYCGEEEGRMSLDRIDNSIGHLQSNVVTSCLRCNYVRRDMPSEAWALVARGMREARERGLFGSWSGRARLPRDATGVAVRLSSG